MTSGPSSKKKVKLRIIVIYSHDVPCRGAHIQFLITELGEDYKFSLDGEKICLKNILQVLQKCDYPSNVFSCANLSLN